MGLRRRVKQSIVAALAVAGFALPPAAGATPVLRAVNESPQSVRDYWTPQRIADATPLDNLSSSASPLTRGATVEFAKQKRQKTHKTVKHVNRFPFRTAGKVVFSIGPNDYVCSGTAVHSPSRSLVWTAGHCVYEQAALFHGYATNWEFIPAVTPRGHDYGVWPATSLATTSQYQAGTPVGDDGSAFDVGAATVAPVGGKTLEQVVGSRKLAFNTNPSKGRLHPFGYPAQQPPQEFTGRQLFRCDSKLVTRDRSVSGPATMGIRCDMTGGASGGGWVNDNGKVVSVTSYGYASRPGILFGPYLGNVAEQLFRSFSR